MPLEPVKLVGKVFLINLVGNLAGILRDFFGPAKYEDLTLTPHPQPQNSLVRISVRNQVSNGISH